MNVDHNPTLCDDSNLVLSLPPFLNDDCWLAILRLCDERSLLSLRKVCKYFDTVASCDSLWYGSCVQLGVTTFHHWESMIACYLRTTRLRHAEDTLMGRNDVCQSTERGLELLRRCVHRGDSRAAEILGWAYLSDCYVPPDKTEAARWFKESQSPVAVFGEAACRDTLPDLHWTFRYMQAPDCDDYLSQFHVRFYRVAEAAQLHYAPALVKQAEQCYDHTEANRLYDEARAHGYRLDTRKAPRHSGFAETFGHMFLAELYMVNLPTSIDFSDSEFVTPFRPPQWSAQRIVLPKPVTAEEDIEVPFTPCDDRVEMTSDRQHTEHQVQKQHTQQRWHHGQQMLEWHLRNPAVVDIPNCAMVTCC
eukprot:TRINITY_DN221_c0_g1_i2.p1 TRINITY_DN221_c0_g1~~TRINITY_DN221_c0_g1_i2.p1  ORF type:complete len:362 (+),score=40.81 TRINITY_DN221_c0_g1_i2:137-1222(+)